MFSSLYADRYVYKPEGQGFDLNPHHLQRAPGTHRFCLAALLAEKLKMCDRVHVCVNKCELLNGM